MKKLSLFLLVSLLFAGCAEDDFVSNSQGDSRYISFVTDVTEMEDLDATRGGGHHNTAHHHDMAGAKTPMLARFTQTNNIDKYLKTRKQGAIEDVETRGRRIDNVSDFYDSFGLIYFMYDPVLYTWAANGSSFTPFIHNEQVRRANGWRTKEYWPGTGRDLMFFAYAPYNAQGVTLSSATDTGTPWLHHEVPQNAGDESDLLISAEEHEVGNYNAIRHIDFKHICAGVRFGIGNKMAPGTIKRIQLQDVYGEGWYHFGATAWDSVKTEKTFTLEQDFIIAPGESNRLLTTGDNVFMMVPQEVPTNGKIVVTINDGEDHELTAYVAHDHWDIGTTTTYWLSTLVDAGDTILYVSPEYDSASPSGIPATGGTATYDVGSYFATAYGTLSPIPWTAYYTIDDDTTKYYTYDPEAISAFTFVSMGQSIDTYNFTANSQIPRSVTQITRQLKQRSPKTENLAFGTGRKGSANCYVVTNPGTYTIPCVYGNCVYADGSTNTDALYGSHSYVNHAGNEIWNVGPKIPESDIRDAVIVWQDAAHLITPNSLQIVTDNGFKSIQFTIDSLNICEGNAIIAVRNNSQQIMWSWHIWVTHHDISQTIRVDNKGNGGGGQTISYFMPVPLGFCERDTVKYAARKFTLNVIQSITNDTARVVINQLAADTHIYGVNAPFYQWGRKDPMLPSTGNGNTNKDIYDCAVSTYTFQISNSNSTTQNSILNPNIIYSPAYDWCNTNIWHRWNTNLTSSTKYDISNITLLKTVYDPSPAGFKMPRANAYVGFTSDGGRTDQGSGWNGTWIIHSQWGPGIQFKTFSGDTPAGSNNPAEIFFPALGSRWNNSGTVSSVSEIGVYHTGSGCDDTGARILTFRTSHIWPALTERRSSAFTVRPVVDDDTLP